MFEDEKKQLEWEEKMIKIYEERTTSRNSILIHVIITAFCQGTLVSLLYIDVVGTTMEAF